MSGYSWVSSGVPAGSGAQRQGAHIRSNLEQLLPSSPGGDACDMLIGIPSWVGKTRETFTLLSFSDYDHQRISITNRQGGRSEHRKPLLCEAGVSVDTPGIATAIRKARAPIMPVSPTTRRLLGRSPSGPNTASHSSTFVTASPPSTINPTPLSSVVTWSQSEQTEFSVPVAVPPCPLSRARDVFLPPPH